MKQELPRKEGEPEVRKKKSSGSLIHTKKVFQTSVNSSSENQSLLYYSSSEDPKETTAKQEVRVIVHRCVVLTLSVERKLANSGLKPMTRWTSAWPPLRAFLLIPI